MSDTESTVTEQKTEPKKWPASANIWPVGKKVIIEDLHGKSIKSCLVVQHTPNYLAVLKVGALMVKLQLGALVKVGSNIFYVAQRAPKQKMVGLFFVCTYEDAVKAAEKEKAPIDSEESVKEKVLEKINNVIS